MKIIIFNRVVAVCPYFKDLEDRGDMGWVACLAVYFVVPYR